MLTQVSESDYVKRFVCSTVLKAPTYDLSRFNADRENYEIMDDNSMQFPTSPKAIEAVRRVELNGYPNLTAANARMGVAKYLGVKPENVLMGNGSMELIDAIARTFVEPEDEAIALSPSYMVYVTRAALYGGKSVWVNRRSDFEWDVKDVLAHMSPKTKLIFICNPNNPTGTTFSKQFVNRIVDEGKLVIIDEAYGEFSSKSLISDYSKMIARGNTIIMRTFSKAFGLAAARVGYILTNPRLIEYLYVVKPALSVNLMAQAAVEAALSDIEHMKRNVEEIRRGREYLINELKEIDGLHPYPSEANYVLIRITTDKINSTRIMSTMRERYRILVRDMKDFYGLNDRYWRITVGRMEQNRKCMAAVREIMAS